LQKNLGEKTDVNSSLLLLNGNNHNTCEHVELCISSTSEDALTPHVGY